MSRRIARTIVARRAEQPITRTAQLAELIASVMPRGKPGQKEIHPATRSFQAIRIHVNRELADLETGLRSEEHTSELQSLMRISYAVFCLKKKNTNNKIQHTTI